MTRPRPTPTIRPAILALATIIWLAPAVGVRPAWASGCHLDERPILARETPGHIPVWQLTGEPQATSSHVLERLPCPGESAHPTNGSMAVVGRLLTSPGPVIVEGSPSALRIADDSEIPDPHPFRLERPPEA